MIENGMVLAGAYSNWGYGWDDDDYYSCQRGGYGRDDDQDEYDRDDWDQEDDGEWLPF